MFLLSKLVKFAKRFTFDPQPLLIDQNDRTSKNSSDVSIPVSISKIKTNSRPHHQLKSKKPKSAYSRDNEPNKKINANQNKNEAKIKISPSFLIGNDQKSHQNFSKVPKQSLSTVSVIVRRSSRIRKILSTQSGIAKTKSSIDIRQQKNDLVSIDEKLFQKKKRKNQIKQISDTRLIVHRATTHDSLTSNTSSIQSQIGDSENLEFSNFDGDVVVDHYHQHHHFVRSKNLKSNNNMMIHSASYDSQDNSSSTMSNHYHSHHRQEYSSSSSYHGHHHHNHGNSLRIYVYFIAKLIFIALFRSSKE